MAALSKMRKRFVDEYMIDMNGAAAYIRAGYKVKNGDVAATCASQLLRNPKVQEAVSRGIEARSKRTEITQDMVVLELAKIGFANMGDFMRVGENGDPILDFSKLTRDQTAALVEVTVDDYVDGRGEDARDVRRVRFKLADKRAALVDLGRHLKMFVDRVESSGPDGGPIQTANVTPEQLADAVKNVRDKF